MMERVQKVLICVLLLVFGVTLVGVGGVLAADDSPIDPYKDTSTKKDSTSTSTTDYGLNFVKNKGMVESNWVEVVGRVIRAIIGIVGVLLLVMMIYGGVLYMTSAGSEDRIGMAKKVLTYAIFGVVVVALAFTVTTYIVNALISEDYSTSSYGSSDGSSNVHFNKPTASMNCKSGEKDEDCIKRYCASNPDDCLKLGFGSDRSWWEKAFFLPPTPSELANSVSN